MFSFLYFRFFFINNTLIILCILYLYILFTYTTTIDVYTSFVYFKLLLLLTNPYLNIVFYLVVFIVVVFLLFNKVFNLHLYYPLVLYYFLNLSVIDLKNVYSIQLINGFYNYHPLLFMIFAIIILMIYTYIYTCISYINKNNIWTYKVFIYILLIVSSGLVITGGYWAQQELNWGGWWYWDPVEVVNLNYVFYIFFLSHLKKNSNFYFVIFNLVIIFLSYLFLIRFDVINSIHSFVVTNIISQYKFYIIILYSALILSIISYYMHTVNLVFFNFYKIKLLVLMCNIGFCLYFNYVLVFKFIFFVLLIYLLRNIYSLVILPIIFFLSINKLKNLLYINSFTYFHLLIFLLIGCIIYYSYNMSIFVKNTYIINRINVYYYNNIVFYSIVDTFYYFDLNIFSSFSQIINTFFIDNYILDINFLYLRFNRSFFFYNLINFNLNLFYYFIYFNFLYILFIWLRKFYFFINSKIKLYF